METSVNDQFTQKKPKTLRPSLFSSTSAPVESLTSEQFVAQETTSYYDIRTSEDAPEYEIKICEYLFKHRIKMSHPSMKKQKFLALFKQSGSLSSLPQKASFLQKRNKLFSQSFRNLAPTIIIPVEIRSAETS